MLIFGFHMNMFVRFSLSKILELTIAPMYPSRKRDGSVAL